MASFRYDERHRRPRPGPPPGLIRGRFDPDIDGPGTYHVAFLDERGRRVAEGTVTSDDGGPVPLELPHEEEGEGDPFQVNLSYRIGSDDRRLPVPVWLSAP